MKTWRLLVAGVIAGLALWLVLARPVLLHFSLGPFLQDRLAIFNPVRNRAPERLARQIITQIHSPSCMKALGQTPNFQGNAAAICEKQTMYPLRNVCKITDRVEFRGQIGISFACGYEGRAPSGAYVTLTFAKRNKDLLLQNYERIY